MWVIRSFSRAAATRLGSHSALPFRGISTATGSMFGGYRTSSKRYKAVPQLYTSTARRPISSSTTFGNASAIGTPQRSDQVLVSGRRRGNITVMIDESEVEFSPVLLRDACSCPQCVHVSTNQRLFSTADIPASIGAEVAEIDSGTSNVKINWHNDVAGYDSKHVTTFSIAELRELSRTGCLPVSRQDDFGSPSLWSQNGLKLPDYDYEAYLTDDQTLFQLMNQLHTYGLAFVTNIPGKESSLATIATRMGPIKDTFYGQTWDVRTVPAAINAAYTSHDLGFHTDLLYFQQPPHIQLLHCIQSASSGGASVFADAYRAAIDLFHTDVEAFETLATVPVNYHYNHPDSNVYRATKPVIDLHPLLIGNTVYNSLSEYKQAWNEASIRNGGAGWDDSMLVDSLNKINWGPPFLAPFSNHKQSTRDLGDTKPVIWTLNDKVEHWHRAAVKFNALLQRTSYLYERNMNPGECVIFDNTRALHSRRAFESADVGKPRWLRGTYVDRDPFFSKMRVLQNRLVQHLGK